MPKFPKFYGMTTVGERGQVVIPKQVRKLLGIKSGDKLIVTSGHPDKKITAFSDDVDDPLLGKQGDFTWRCRTLYPVFSRVSIQCLGIQNGKALGRERG